MGVERARSRISEVALSGGTKLVLIASDTGLFVRLRALGDGEWRFLTPPLMLPPRYAAGLVEEASQIQGYPVKLTTDGGDSSLNLLAYKGRIHVHHGKTQMNGSVEEFAGALSSLGVEP